MDRTTNISEPLQLIGKSGNRMMINNTTGEILGDYNRASVPPRSSQLKSKWLIYKFKNFDHGYTNKRPQEECPAIVESGEVEMKLEPILSAQGFDLMNPGIIMFEHSQNRGYGKLFQTSVNDLTDANVFRPQERVTGVSSCIINGGVWSLFTEPNFKGTKVKLGSIDEFPKGKYDFGELIRIRSMQLVRES